jgi:hypothetical protein
MSPGEGASTDRQIVRLLQICLLLERLLEIRIERQQDTFEPSEARTEQLLAETKVQCTDHRRCLRQFVDQLGGDDVAGDQIDRLVAKQTDRYQDDVTGLLQECLHAEECITRICDTLIDEIRGSSADLDADRSALVAALEGIRQDELERIADVSDALVDSGTPSSPRNTP